MLSKFSNENLQKQNQFTTRLVGELFLPSVYEEKKNLSKYFFTKGIKI
jgi:hypothetical protein